MMDRAYGKNRLTFFGATPGTTCSLVRLDLLDLIPGKLPGLESKFSGMSFAFGVFPGGDTGPCRRESFCGEWRS